MYLKSILKSGIFPLFSLALIGTLDSCIVLQPEKRPEMMSEETLFRGQGTRDTATIADIPWRSLFSDQHLVALIDEAIRNNPDMQVAMARVNKAEATLQQSRSAFFPALGANAGATYQEVGKSDVNKTYQLLGSSSWEADVWGKLRNTKRASLNLFLESEAYKRAVQTKLVADVADTYYTLLALDAKLHVTERTVEFRNSDVETMKVMKENDMVTGADLVQSQANLFSAKVTIPDIRQSIYEAENALSVLLGRNPGPIERDSLSGQKIPVNLNTGIPAQLLTNRPDVREAEYQLRYGYEMTNAARKYFYPSLTINATVGYDAGDLTQFFKPSSVFWNLAGSLVQPIFNKGLNKQRLKMARADQEEYLAEYRQILLKSSQEVANAQYAIQASTEKISLRAKQIGFLEKSVDYTMELLKYSSSTNYTDVLMAEVNLLSAQLGEINDKLQQLQSIVTLYRSLGGGWKE